MMHEHGQLIARGIRSQWSEVRRKKNRPLLQAVLTSLSGEKAKAPTSPKVGALPFSLSSHKENQ
jgi:hypothetical protein